MSAAAEHPAVAAGPGESAIEVEDVHLSFPMVKYRARGVKEAVLDFIRRARHPERRRLFWALQGVSFTVKTGEVLGLVGRNGSGKSTLLRVISGIYEPDQGHVVTRGRISSLLELGAGFKDVLNGYENVRLSAAIMGLSNKQIDDLLPEIVEFSGLEDFMHQPIKTYSSGMRARLGFAVATTVEPDILLIDEALAVGDAAFKEKSMARVEEMVSRDDTTVVIVSHSAGDLERMCSRLVLLDRGKVVTEGAVPDVMKAYGEISGRSKGVRQRV